MMLLKKSKFCVHSCNIFNAATLKTILNINSYLSSLLLLQTGSIKGFKHICAIWHMCIACHYSMGSVFWPRAIMVIGKSLPSCHRLGTGWLLPVLDNINQYHDWCYQYPVNLLMQSTGALLYVSGHTVACVHKLLEHTSYSPDIPRDIFDFVWAHGS